MARSMNWFFQVQHGANAALVDHGTIYFNPTGPTSGTINVSPVHFPPEGGWPYSIDQNGNLTATLTPPMELTNGGNPDVTPIFYCSMNGQVTTDSQGNVTSARGTLTVCSAADSGPGADPPDTWDASVTPVGGHHHERDRRHNEAKA